MVMQLRNINLRDVEALRQIHREQYGNEFEFPDLTSRNFIQTFAVTDNADRIISGGGIKLIAEAVLITNKEYPVLERKEALEEILSFTQHICARYGYDQLHAFVQDPMWIKVLNKYKFRTCAGQALVKDIYNGL